MFSKRPKTYSLGMLLLGLLTIVSVRAGFGQDLTNTNPNTNPNPTTASYANGVKTRIRGTVVSITDCQLIMRDECGVESVVLLNQRANGKLTEVRLSGHRSRMSVGNICPGSCVRIEGRGNCEGQLVAEEIKSRGCEACAPACPPPCPTACAPEPPACPAPCPAPCNPCH